MSNPWRQTNRAKWYRQKKFLFSILSTLFLLLFPGSVSFPAEASPQPVQEQGSESAAMQESGVVIPEAEKPEDDLIYDPGTDDGEPFIIYKVPLWAVRYIDENALNQVAENTESLGDSGRFFIPRVGVDVALYYAWEYDHESGQAIGDAYDSAVYTPHKNGQPYIADHWNQGFIGIRSLQSGDVAYWKHQDRIDVFYCVRAFTGTNDGVYIYNENMENCYFLNEGGLFTYTCLENWQHVAAAFWQPVATFWF